MVDERIAQNEAEKKQVLSNLEKTYGDMINESDKYYQAQIDASKQWVDEQKRLQQAQTDHTINVIEQEKAQTTKDYKREQSGAYVDWQKESNRYGSNAEYMAANGLAGSGYSESSQVSMYNTYQNRVAQARESWQLAIQNYNNKITEARLQNDAILAEIAYKGLQQQLELSLAGFQYKNDLIREKEAQKQSISNSYWGRYTDILDQINTEKAMAEQKRQFDVKMAEEKRQYEEAMAIQKEEIAIARDRNSGGGGGGGTAKKASLPKIQHLYLTSGQANKAKANAKEGGGGAKFGVNTDYYSGSLNSDAKKYGTFANGYQPKGISGHGELKKTGKTIANNTVTLYGQNRTVTQNVWKAEDNTLWYWEGRQNKYIEINASK